MAERRVSRNVAPVRVDHPASAEALRMVQEWCAELDRRNASMALRGGGEVNLLETIRQLHLSEKPVNQGSGKETAAGVATRSARRYDGSDESLDVAPFNANVLETDRIMSHLRSVDTPSYVVVVSWARGNSVVAISKAMHCSIHTVYGNLKAAVVAMTSHVLLRTFA